MITVNTDKARAIAHDLRRQARAAAFAPLDARISARLPGSDDERVEAERQAIRDRYAQVQQVIDAAATPEEMKVSLGM